MALVVNTNVASITSQFYVNQTNRDMADTMARLSSGKRINTAADDAAGVAIASRLQAESRGLNQAVRNANDAQAMIDTAEGALVEAVNILQRMRELAVQSSNDTNNSSDRTNLHTEFSALKTELTRIEESTTWAGVKILDGSGGAATNGVFKYMVGTGRTDTSATDQITVTFGNITTMIAALSGASLTSQASAAAAIEDADTAIGLVNTERATLGSVSNRLDHTVSNLGNNVSNIESARSRIEDADFAAESAALAKNQIMLQAGTAMLAQANASQQNVLSLIS
jgi:flagellin